jgi:hypothetical protein
MEGLVCRGAGIVALLAMSARMSTVELENLVASWHRLRRNGVRAGLGTEEIEGVIAARQRDLLAHGEAILAEARQMGLLNPYDAVASGGSRLHVPFDAREESVTNWLAWVLRAAVIGDVERRTQVVSSVLRLALDDDGLRLTHGYMVEEAQVIPLLPDAPAAVGVLDLVVLSSDTTVVIENKIGDLSVEKNADYRRALDRPALEQNNPGWPNIKYMLLIPSSDLESLRSGEERELDVVQHPGAVSHPAAVEAGLNAFQNVTWESFLAALRATSALYANEPREIGIDAWRAVVATFMGFVEAWVLDFSLARIRELLESEKPLLSAGHLNELNAYVQFRRLL